MRTKAAIKHVVRLFAAFVRLFAAARSAAVGGGGGGSGGMGVLLGF